MLDILNEVCDKIEVDLVQAPLNVIDRSLQTSGWLNRLKHNGVEVHARSVFLQGLLLMDRSEIPEKFSPWASLWDQWHEKLKYLGISPLTASLAYPLSIEQVDRVVDDVNSTKQLEAILAAVNMSNKPSILPL